MKLIKSYPAIISLVAFAVTILFQSCEFEKKGLPYSKGKSSEILVVTNNKAQWKSAIGDTIVNFFYQPIPGLPQPEPSFTLVNIPEEAFTSMFKKQREILIVNVDTKFKKPQIELRENLWAKPQQVVKISAPTTEGFIEEFQKNKDLIFDLFIEKERKRIINTYKSFSNAKLIAKLKEKFGIYLAIPGGFKISKSAKNFMWIRKETLSFSQGLLIYLENYIDTNQFNYDHIISWRNITTKRYVPGPSENSYMMISDEVIKPEIKEINFKDRYAVKTHGLWKVYNDFMGGPFISYTLLDKRNNKLLTIDAYVYAPSENKRDLVRQMDAIIHSLKFVSNN